MNLSKISKHLCFCLFGMTLVYTHNAYAAMQISYKDIQAFFEKDHPLLRADMVAVNLEKAKRSGLRRSFYPEVSAIAGLESYSSNALADNDSGYIGSELTVNLYRGGMDKIKDTISNIDIKLAKLSVEERRRHLKIDAVKSYWSIAFLIEQLKFIEEVKVSVKSLQKSLRMKIKSGVVTSTQLDGLRLSAKEFEFLEQKTNLELRKEYMLFAYLLGLDASQSTNLTIDYKDQWQKVLVSDLTKKKHQSEKIKRFNLLVEKHQFASKLASNSWRPRLDFYAGYGIAPFKEREYADSSDRLEGEFGLRLSVPLSDLLTKEPMVKAQVFQASYMAAKRDQLTNKLRLQERKLKLALDQKASLFTTAKSLSDGHYDLYKKRLSEYRRGLRSAFDITESLRALKDSKFEMLSLKKELFLISECLGYSENTHVCGEL